MENVQNNPVSQASPVPQASPMRQADLNNSTTLQELKEQYESLRHVVISLVVLIIVVTGSLNLYLLREVRNKSADLNALRPQIAEFQKTTAPALTEVVRKFADFGRTHPDFAQVLAKYGIKPTPATTPAPAAPAAKK